MRYIKKYLLFESNGHNSHIVESLEIPIKKEKELKKTILDILNGFINSDIERDYFWESDLIEKISHIISDKIDINKITYIISNIRNSSYSKKYSILKEEIQTYLKLNLDDINCPYSNAMWIIEKIESNDNSDTQKNLKQNILDLANYIINSSYEITWFYENELESLVLEVNDTVSTNQSNIINQIKISNPRTYYELKEQIQNGLGLNIDYINTYYINTMWVILKIDSIISNGYKQINGL